MDAMSNTNRTIEAIFIALHGVNYSEFPDSWVELFDNLEQLTFAVDSEISVIVGAFELSLLFRESSNAPTTHICGGLETINSSDLVGKVHVFRPDLKLRDPRPFNE